MKTASRPLEDETHITEITIQPDGRVYVFGTSRQILDILVDLDPLSIKLSRLMEQVRSVEHGQVHETGEGEIAPGMRPQ